MVFFYTNLKVTKNKLKIICIELNMVFNCTHKPKQNEDKKFNLFHQ